MGTAQEFLFLQIGTIIKIDVPHLNTSIEKYISDFEWLESINIRDFFNEKIQQNLI